MLSLLPSPLPPSSVVFLLEGHMLSLAISLASYLEVPLPFMGSTNLEKAEIDHWLEYSLTALTQHQNATLLLHSRS